MNKLLDKLPSELKKNLRKKTMPNFEKPMLATLTKNYFDSDDWIYESKFDGVRCLIFKNKNKVFLKSRNNKSLSDAYPELVEAAKKFCVDQIILDGEVVAFKGAVTSFEKLQGRSGLRSAEKALATGIKIHIYIFDILYLDGYELLNLPLIKRKTILESAIKFKDPIRYTEHKNTKGIKFFKAACKKGLEGIIAKKRDSKYVHVRSPNWLKFKCVADQELVIGGYTEPQKSRVGFGALLLGYYQPSDFALPSALKLRRTDRATTDKSPRLRQASKNGKFMFAGKVGTGFNDKFLKDFSKKLKKIETKKNPFSSKEMEAEDVHFVKPKYVAEIGFEEWTKDNKLRHPRFQGLRYDKLAKSVVKETPKQK